MNIDVSMGSLEENNSNEKIVEAVEKQRKLLNLFSNTL